MWKAVTFIINFCLITYINFHGVLHNFWASRGTGNTSFEAKLIHDFISLRLEVLYEIFMDLQKVYEALDKDICMDIL